MLLLRLSAFDLRDLSVSHDLDNAVSVFAIITHAFCLFHDALVTAFRQALKQWVDTDYYFLRNQLMNTYNT